MADVTESQVSNQTLATQAAPTLPATADKPAPPKSREKWKRVGRAGAAVAVVIAIVGFLNGVAVLKDFQIYMNVAAAGLCLIIFFGAIIWELVDLGQDVKSTLARSQATQQRTEAFVKGQETRVDKLNANLTDLLPVLKATATDMRQNAEFVHKGFIGLQQKAIEVERIPVENARLRYSLHAHLPSHIRSSALTVPMAKKIYQGWTPERLIENYTALINERWRAHCEFLNQKGECWELYSKAALEKYAGGETDFDVIIDPVEEQKSRFERLKALNKMDNYHLRIFDKSLGSSLMLRVTDATGDDPNERGALLMDLRLPGSVTIFDESCYGVFSQSQPVCHAYRKKVELIVSSAVSSNQVITDRDQLEDVINGWIAKIK